MIDPDGGDYIPTTSIKATRFTPTHDRYGLPIFRAEPHIRITIEEDGLAHDFAMPADEAHSFAQYIHRLADGETLSSNIGKALSRAGVVK